MTKVEQELPFLESLAVGRLIESTRFPKEGRKNFKPEQYTKEILASFKFWRNSPDPALVQRIAYLPDMIDSIHVTRDTRDVMSIHSSLTKPVTEYIKPLDKSKIPKGHCKNTGKPIHYRYKNNKAIDGRKKKDCCPCSACVKLRWSRDQEISEYRKGLKKKRSRKKKDPMRYK